MRCWQILDQFCTFFQEDLQRMKEINLTVFVYILMLVQLQRSSICPMNFLSLVGRSHKEFNGWCSITLLLVCSSFSWENGHLLPIRQTKTQFRFRSLFPQDVHIPNASVLNFLNVFRKLTPFKSGSSYALPWYPNNLEKHVNIVLIYNTVPPVCFSTFCKQ